MINPFNRFYDTEITVYEQGENSYDKKGEKTLLGNVICDIQPYSDDTESKIYGLDESRSYKLYCDKTDLRRRMVHDCENRNMVIWYDGCYKGC